MLPCWGLFVRLLFLLLWFREDGNNILCEVKAPEGIVYGMDEWK
ncbi:hypothetical protein Daudx_1495 [Candidatus Desulforudis audaxviator]|nr:hypothetical protein Daudx_1495 [Candidatus Desulforudis audaxviator]